MSISIGFEEDLAHAIDKNFYESYKQWTFDNRTASSSQKVWRYFALRHIWALVYNLALSTLKFERVLQGVFTHGNTIGVYFQKAMHLKWNISDRFNKFIV